MQAKLKFGFNTQIKLWKWEIQGEKKTRRGNLIHIFHKIQFKQALVDIFFQTTLVYQPPLQTPDIFNQT